MTGGDSKKVGGRITGEEYYRACILQALLRKNRGNGDNLFSSDVGVWGSDGRGGRDVQDQGRIKVDTAGTFADCRHLPNFQGSNSLYLIIAASIIITDFP